MRRLGKRMSASEDLMWPMNKQRKLGIPSLNYFNRITNRSVVGGASQVDQYARSYVSQNIVDLGLKLETFSATGINKVFSSAWIDNRRVLFGTKCNRIMELDTKDGLIKEIEMIEPSEQQPNLSYVYFNYHSQQDVLHNSKRCLGIHSVETNPSMTAVATTGNNGISLNVYSLPTYKPIAIGIGAANNMIFDLKWITDDYLISGSVDKSLKVWCIDDLTTEKYHFRDYEGVYSKTADDDFSHERIYPKASEECNMSDKIRAMSYNRRDKELGVLSMNSLMHIWDINTFRQKSSIKLRRIMEAVCIDINVDRNLYVIGTHTSVAIVDPRSDIALYNVVLPHSAESVRSIKFHENMITIGTGSGMICFFDVVAQKWLQICDNCHHPFSLNANKCSVDSGSLFLDYVSDCMPPAIYTHNYSPCGSKIFAAGGPLQSGLEGYSVSLFS